EQKAQKASLPVLRLLAVALLLHHCTAWRPLDCDGVEEDGVRWDVVRSDLSHVIREVLHGGALARDLHASKDSGGRDPAVSYGDVQLGRHLERLQSLADVLPSPKSSRCPLGAHCVQLFVSALYSGLLWPDWFRRHKDALWVVVHGSNWTEAIESGWPFLELLAMVAELHGSPESLPDDCQALDSEIQRLPSLVGRRPEFQQ
ncbi:unnamed protein product, partial [Polarella glacialis]